MLKTMKNIIIYSIKVFFFLVVLFVVSVGAFCFILFDYSFFKEIILTIIFLKTLFVIALFSGIIIATTEEQDPFLPLFWCKELK